MEASRSYVRVSVKVRVRVSVKVRVQVSVKDQCQLITKGMVSTSLYSCVRIGKINKLKTQGADHSHLASVGTILRFHNGSQYSEMRGSVDCTHNGRSQGCSSVLHQRKKEEQSSSCY